VRGAILDLEINLAEVVHPLSAREQSERPGYRQAIMDSVIRQAIEKRLRDDGQRMPHVLYALTTLGRSDREGRSGFQHAGHVLQWMSEPVNYPNVVPPGDHQPPPVPADRWWPPGEPPHPRRVIKRSLKRETFSFEQFTNSISQAMLGRPGAGHLSSSVAAWTLWGLVGQQDVLTAQLAVGVMECLRRVDDIAYLRWAAISKDIESISDFRDEATALIEHPSPRLVFQPDGAPRVRPERRDLLS
jgi:hypothetical protein